MKTSRQARRIARQLFHLCQVDGQVEPDRARMVVQGVAGSRRRGTLAVLSDFLRFVRLDRDRRLAVVESATALPDDLKNAVQADLARTYGAGVETVFAVNAALIGGMRIKVGSDVYDASVRAKLSALEARL
jgi:F-type H+-transporting ATPase subunit delta